MPYAKSATTLTMHRIGLSQEKIKQDEMKLWIARDKDGYVYLHRQKPSRSGKMFFSKWSMCMGNIILPEVTWENSPQEVELKLINKTL